VVAPAAAVPATGMTTAATATATRTAGNRRCRTPGAPIAPTWRSDAIAASPATVAAAAGFVVIANVAHANTDAYIAVIAAALDGAGTQTREQQQRDA